MHVEMNIILKSSSIKGAGTNSVQVERNIILNLLPLRGQEIWVGFSDGGIKPGLAAVQGAVCLKLPRLSSGSGKND